MSALCLHSVCARGHGGCRVFSNTFVGVRVLVFRRTVDDATKKTIDTGTRNGGFKHRRERPLLTLRWRGEFCLRNTGYTLCSDYRNGSICKTRISHENEQQFLRLTANLNKKRLISDICVKLIRKPDELQQQIQHSFASPFEL